MSMYNYSKLSKTIAELVQMALKHQSGVYYFKFIGLNYKAEVTEYHDVRIYDRFAETKTNILIQINDINFYREK